MPAFLPTAGRIPARPLFQEGETPGSGNENAPTGEPILPGGNEGGGLYGPGNPPPPPTSCPSGYYDGGDGWCYPISEPLQPIPPPTPPPSGVTTTSTQPVQVTVQNTINLANGVSQTLADNITGAISGVGRAVATATQTVLQKIADALKTIGAQIWDAIKNGISGIVSIIQQVASNVFDAVKSVVSAIASQVGTILADVKDAIVTAVKAVEPLVTAVAQQVQQINDTLIKPIATFINTTVKTIADLTTAIERDLHSGLQGILDIPNQIANGLTTIDATMQRTVQQLGAANLGVAKSSIDYEGEQLPPKYSAATAAMLSGKVLSDAITTTFTDKVGLSTESIQQVSQEAIAAIGPLLKDVVNTVWQIAKSPFDQQHADWNAVENVFIGLLDGLLSILVIATTIGSLVEPLIETAKEEANAAVPTTKLDVGTIIQARLRGFIDDATSSVELSKLGFDATRQQVLKDLSVFLADPQSALDWWYRGLIQESDLNANLKDHGVTDKDVIAIKSGSIRLPGIDEVARWRNFGLIDDTGVTTILHTLRWDDAQISSWLQTYQTRETAAGRATIDGRLNAFGKGWLNTTAMLATPDDVNNAGAREGLHPETTRLAWLAHWNLPPIQSIIQSYFRGMRTYTEVQFHMEALNIPSELWDELIQINRPLIPFRSIPTYVSKGYMSENDAQTELAAHGFDTHHINIILQALKPTSSVSQSASAQAVKTLSIANARELYDLGSITSQQYEDILVQHGYSTTLAQAQAQADILAFHTKQRKQTLTQLKAEVETGVTTLDDAVSQLNGLGFSQAEISVFQAQVLKSLKVNQKHPSISEMKAFIKAGYMTTDQFKTELIAQGWTDPWLTMWVELETPPPAQPTSTTP